MEEWDLTNDLPAVDQNLGLEGIIFISDAILVEEIRSTGNSIIRVTIQAMEMGCSLLAWKVLLVFL